MDEVRRTHFSLGTDKADFKTIVNVDLNAQGFVLAPVGTLPGDPRPQQLSSGNSNHDYNLSKELKNRIKKSNVCLG